MVYVCACTLGDCVARGREARSDLFISMVIACTAVEPIKYHIHTL